MSSCVQSELEKINGVLSEQYECRRRMLIKRLDVTVQSFSWSDRAKARQTLSGIALGVDSLQEGCGLIFL